MKLYLLTPILLLKTCGTHPAQVPPPPVPIVVHVSPRALTVDTAAPGVIFTATVDHDQTGKGVVWTLIGPNGMLCSPQCGTLVEQTDHTVKYVPPLWIDGPVPQEPTK